MFPLRSLTQFFRRWGTEAGRSRRTKDTETDARRRCIFIIVLLLLLLMTISQPLSFSASIFLSLPLSQYPTIYQTSCLLVPFLVFTHLLLVRCITRHYINAWLT